jgi:hypothetical protein
MDISIVLDYILNNKWTNPLFKRRFTAIIMQWIRILNKAKIMEYL